jgi:glycosyltransferase involved in cell wall biosynthesis
MSATTTPSHWVQTLARPLMMKTLVLTRYARMGASSRMRVLQYIDAWSGSNHGFHVCPLLNDAYLRAKYQNENVPMSTIVRAYTDRARALQTAQNFDLIWFEKELFPNLPAWCEQLLAHSQVPYVVDFDDAIFHNYDMSHWVWQRMLKNKIGTVMRHAALVTCGNEYLAQYARSAGAESVVILPTVVDINRYPLKRDHNTADKLIVGWIGTPATAKFLEPLMPVIAQLCQQFPIEFVLIGLEPQRFVQPFIRCENWSEDTEADQIGQFDIGVMPLSDGPWEQGKCGYKLIQYMACAKPVVASPVGVNRKMVLHGENGFLATDHRGWGSALATLLASAELRQKMGQRGRILVENEYSLQVTSPRLLHWLEQVVLNRASLCAD